MGDEPGIADLTAFWDFDLSAPSLAAMREWLKTQCRDLARLDDEWESTFAGWDEIVPMTTRDAIKQQQLPGLSISGPPSVHAGENADFRISPNGKPSVVRDIIHVEIADPDGNVVPYYSGNQLAMGGVISYWLPLALNDKAGVWTIRARDLLTGGLASARLQVEP